MDIQSMARMTGIVLGAGMLSVTSAEAGVLYTNGAPIQSGHDAVDRAQADDFDLGSNSVLTGATVSIFELDPKGAAAWDGVIQYFIFEESGGKPGAVLASGLGTAISKTPTSTNSFGWLFSDVSFEFDSGIALESDTYWFGMVLSDSFDDGDAVNWAATPGQIGSRSKNNSNQAMPHLGWTNNVFDFAFELHGEVPTPGVLTTLGLGGLGLTRRRRR